MTRGFYLLLALFALAGCGTAQKPGAELIGKTVEVRITVPVPCVPDNLPGEPAYVDTDEALRAAPGGPDRYQMIAAGRVQRNQYLKAVRPVLAACRAPAPP